MLGRLMNRKFRHFANTVDSVESSNHACIYTLANSREYITGCVECRQSKTKNSSKDYYGNDNTSSEI